MHMLDIIFSIYLYAHTNLLPYNLSRTHIFDNDSATTDRFSFAEILFVSSVDHV